MSDTTILVEGLANVNGVDRGCVYDLPEPQARMLIKAGFARIWKEVVEEEPPAPDAIPETVRAKAKKATSGKPVTKKSRARSAESTTDAAAKVDETSITEAADKAADETVTENTEDTDG